MLKAGTTLKQKFNDTSYTFTIPGAESNYKMAQVRVRLNPTTTQPRLYKHAQTRLYIEVEAGELTLNLKNEERLLMAGRRAVVQAGEAYALSNKSTAEATFILEFYPALNYEGLIATMAELSQSNPTWFNELGQPAPLLMARLLDTFAGHIYVAGWPIFIQKLVFSALAPIAHWAGYTWQSDYTNQKPTLTMNNYLALSGLIGLIIGSIWYLLKRFGKS